MTDKPTAAALERIGLLIRSLEKLEPDELEYMRALPGAERIRQWLYAQPSADGLAEYRMERVSERHGGKHRTWWEIKTDRPGNSQVCYCADKSDAQMILAALRTRQPADTGERGKAGPMTKQSTSASKQH